MPNNSTDFGLVMNDNTQIHYFIIDKPPDVETGRDKLFINTILIQNNTNTSQTNTKLADAMTSGSAPQIDVTRCICGMDHDDGFMICCDKCLVWQHIVCMDVNRKKIPDKFFCEKCLPRPINVAKAKFMQRKYLENLKNLKKNESETLLLNGGMSTIDLHANNSDLYDHEMAANCVSEFAKDTQPHMRHDSDDTLLLKKMSESNEPIVEIVAPSEIILSADEEVIKSSKITYNGKQRKYRPKTIKEELETSNENETSSTLENNDKKTACKKRQREQRMRFFFGFLKFIVQLVE